MLFEMLVCVVFSSLNVRCVQALVVYGGGHAGRHGLCAPLMVQVQTKGPVSLGVAVVKIFEWVSGEVGWGGGGLGETDC